MADITSQYKPNKINVLEDIEYRFLKNTCSNQHQLFRTKIDLLREAPTSLSKFRVKRQKNVKSVVGQRFRPLERQDQDEPQGLFETVSAQFVKHLDGLPDLRQTTSALQQHNSENLAPQQFHLRQSQSIPEVGERTPKLKSIKRTGLLQKFKEVENPKHLSQKVSIVNKNNLFLIPFLKNKIKQMYIDTNSPHIADIPVIHPLSSITQKVKTQPPKSQYGRAPNRIKRNQLRKNDKDDFGPW